MTEVVSSLVVNVVGYLCGVAKMEMAYIWNSFENVKNLKKEVDKLSSMKGRIQRQIDLAKSKGERLLEGVEEWMKEADAEISDATEFYLKEAEAKNTFFNLRLCVNLSALRHYGKASTKKISLLRQHQGDGKDYETSVSFPPPTPGFVDLYRRKNLENIDSQKLALKEIIESIEDDKIQIIGINGLGGVGKTTLASEVAAKMKNQFTVIVFITVSQIVDAKMIQEKIRVAAHRILNGDKVLIILDDVWEELRLEEVGIPCGSDYMNCKILFTTRRKDVCEAMNAQKIITVYPLKYEEAWTLFECVVGKSELDDSLKEVALRIVDKCGGLPLFVQAAGKALKKKGLKSWEAALGRLRDPTDEDTPFKRKGIMQLKLSYDNLESEVAKSCFLLCSMFPVNETIGLRRLTHYGFALRIFNNLDTNIQDAKHRVQVAVDSLQSSFLLLPEKEKKFKMHDLVRDMAMLITSKGDDKFWVQSGEGLIEWQPKKHLVDYKKISLMGNKIRKLHNHGLLFAHLDTFLIQDNGLLVIPDEFFQGMGKLKVLDMSGNHISSLPQSLKHLRELVMLDLSSNESPFEISILGELTCLEILKLRRTGIKNIPKEIGQLTSLRLLDVSFCSDLSYVTPGVISKLIWLEELYFHMKKGDCDFLVELRELKSLKILHLTVSELKYIPEDFHYETLIEFYVKNNFYVFNKYHYKRILEISGISYPFAMPIMKLIQLCEMFNLQNIKDMNHILPSLYKEDFDKLKYIDLTMCDNVRSLVKTCDLDAMRISVTSDEPDQRKTKGKYFSRVEEIKLRSMNRLELLWDSPHQYLSFSNLAKIIIEECSSLLELFPISVAKGLVNLKYLNITSCESLVVVISAGDEQRGGSKTEMATKDLNIVFPLTKIYLQMLPKLESFYSGRSIIKYPSLKFVAAYGCPNMERWSYGDNHMPIFRFELKKRQYSNINDYVVQQHKV
ncbi:disease resistance protein UNI-like [Bidens hawaiensis]|uniref:disease resistance protein UNI-like n=1 Tax=Bidens hawaiensis TaxID=980011 RepID=UPI00404A644B